MTTVVSMDEAFTDHMSQCRQLHLSPNLDYYVGNFFHWAWSAARAIVPAVVHTRVHSAIQAPN